MILIKKGPNKDYHYCLSAPLVFSTLYILLARNVTDLLPSGFELRSTFCLSAPVFLDELFWDVIVCEGVVVIGGV